MLRGKFIAYKHVLLLFHVDAVFSVKCTWYVLRVYNLLIRRKKATSNLFLNEISLKNFAYWV